MVKLLVITYKVKNMYLKNQTVLINAPHTCDNEL